jgi:2-polyprenyl-3-methyl-5-hydroxy-6-metoxy-1,4-benzoquinol methylase
MMPNNATRDFDVEASDRPEHRYAYDFDYRMHRYMMRAFRASFMSGNALELGCYKGHFTRLLCEAFSDVEVVDASARCIEEAGRALDHAAVFHHARFEEFVPRNNYANIFLIHTLEHIDDPVATLARIGQWLAPQGRLFIASPNAHAASRQIAVAMGVIPHASAVTDAERAHGHRTTYSFDTLAADIRSAGLHVFDQGGILFKGLANFQMDKALAADIITPAYLDGCYSLGKIYPDLCASIYFVCERHIAAQ